MDAPEPLLVERTPIVGSKFSTEAFGADEQFDAWREFMSSMSDLEPIEAPRAGFVASAESYPLGSLVSTSFQLSPVNFKYTKDIIRRANFDHWCIGLVTKGRVAAESDDTTYNAAAGVTVLNSYATPFSGKMDAMNFSGMFFSRDDFWDIADDLDKAAHQQVTGPLSQIIGDFLFSLQSRVDKLTKPEASAIDDAFGHLLRAMVQPTSVTLEAAKAPIAAAQFDRARRFINGNLKSPDLTPATICASLGVSRRQLYSLFEPHGGVAKFITNRRLSACYNALTKTPDRMLIGVIAYEFGFASLSSFYRQFQARYGFSPGEARSAWLNGHDVSAGVGTTLVDWLLHVT